MSPLFLKRHGAFAVIAASAVCGIVGLAFDGALFSIFPDSLHVVPPYVILPLLPSMILAASMTGAIRSMEQSASRRFPWLRCGLLGILLLGMGAICSAPFIPDTGAFGAGAIARNCLGFAGLALASGAALGKSLSWFLPSGWLLASSAVFSSRRIDSSGMWMFFSMPAAHEAALATALTLFTVGFLLFLVTSSASGQASTWRHAINRTVDGRVLGDP